MLKFYQKSSYLFTLSFLIYLGAILNFPAFSMEEREGETPSISRLAPKWVPSLNFLYNEKFALEESDSPLDSYRIADWHFSQAEELAYFYNTYQGGAARNVLKAMFSLIYAQNGELKIKHYPIDGIFMSGWKPEDTPLGPFAGTYVELFSHMRHTKEAFTKKTSKPFNNVQIHTLGTVLEKHSLTFENFLVDKKLTSQTTANAVFKTQECHSEKGPLFYLNLNIDHILSYFFNGLKGKIVVKDFLLSMASYRDMCPICMDYFTRENSDIYPLSRLQKLIMKKLESVKSDSASITLTTPPEVIVAFSSFSPNSMEERLKSGYTKEDRPRHYKWIPNIKSHKFYLMESPYTVVRSGNPKNQSSYSRLNFVPALFRTENYIRPPSFDNRWEEDKED